MSDSSNSPSTADSAGQTRVIALDGPAGSGKSTVARVLADKLGYIHADSGAMYRVVTLALMEQTGAEDSPEAFGAKLAENPVDFRTLGCSVRLENGAQSNRINDRDVGERIRTPEVTARIRYIADNRSYREAVNELLREFARGANLVVDGRDIGTEVFPDTPYKFFLEASPRVRAERRAAEFREKGLADPYLDELEKDIAARDAGDRNRGFGALKQAKDAILIDTSSLKIDDVVARLLNHLQVQF